MELRDRSHRPEFLFNPTYISRDNFWLSFNDILYNVSCLSMALNNKEDPLFIKKIVENTKFRLEEIQKLYTQRDEARPQSKVVPMRGVSMDGFLLEDEYESHNR